MSGTAAMQVEVRDHALWIRHITATDELKTWLEQIPGGASVRLIVDGVAGDWRKLDNGKDGRPTAAFIPVTEPGRSCWHALQNKRGTHVSFAVQDGD